jgi:translation initiation factor 4A
MATENTLNTQTTEMNDAPTSAPRVNYSELKVENWDDYDMDPRVLRGIYAYGYEKPSPIQQKAIRPVMDGRDLIAQAQSGTGKTGTFSIAALNVVDTAVNEVQVLVLSPTRELSRQSHSVLTSIGAYVKDLRVQLLIGGTSTGEDAEQLRTQTPHVVVGCPGRVFDMIKRRNLRVDQLKYFILDEADEMLSTGFKDQIYNIFQYFSTTTRVALFSATIPPDIEALTTHFMEDPVKILVKSEMLTLEGIQQYYVALETDGQKFDTLKDLYASLSVSQCIIYCNSVRRVEELYEAMVADDYTVSRIHSNMTKEDRETAYVNFKNGTNRILISSNVTARGIDIQQVSTVINFDVPRDVHTYLHRIGRSGRWGRKGVAINFVTKIDMKNMKQIEQHYNTEIQELPAEFVKC